MNPLIKQTSLHYNIGRSNETVSQGVINMRVSIKRRLLISNILMVMIPTLLTGALIGGALSIFANRFEVNVTAAAFVPIEQGQLLDASFSELEVPTQDAVLVHQLDSGHYVLVLPDHMNSRFQELNLAAEQRFVDIVVGPEEFVQFIDLLEEWETIIPIIVILILVAFALLINHLLIKFVFKPIMTSLNVLTEGVHEITVGNLSYRLKHDMGNEFDIVGANFNEMATRLYEMVEQRKVDEKNRKELIAGISHDLRTPLTSIRTYAEGIELGMATTPETQEKYLTTIKNKTKDIEHIINQLFLFSKLDIGEFPMRLDKRNAKKWLSDFAETIVDEYLAKGLRIELENHIDQTFFLVDSVQLKSVLINILENSVKYGKSSDGQVLIESAYEGENIVITLTDNGPGVPDDDLDQLFDVFYRGDKARSNPGQGSGLGLAISAKMIERMGGSVSVRNADGGGLQIRLMLPMVKGDF